MTSAKIYRGNVSNAAFADEIDCVVTSPPYYRQRTYGGSSLELGRESTVEEYVGNLANLFARLPLPQWGNVWVNLGDKRGRKGELLGVPYRFLHSMQEAGFLLIDHIVWGKGAAFDDGTAVGNWQPEPASLRINGNAHEVFFRFTKSPGAYFDADAVNVFRSGVSGGEYLPVRNAGFGSDLSGRRIPNVWISPPSKKTGTAHFAMAPVAPFARAIASSCPLQVCRVCGEPRRRMVSKVVYDDGRGIRRSGKYSVSGLSGRNDTGSVYVPRKPVSLGWTDCGHSDYRSGAVFDPFCGSGTTGVAAVLQGRSFIGYERYDEYAAIAERRIAETVEEMRGFNPAEFILASGRPEPATAGSCRESTLWQQDQGRASLTNSDKRTKEGEKKLCG